MTGRRHVFSARPLLAPRHWGTIAEAGVALVTASLVTRVLPFQRYIGIGARRLSKGRKSECRNAARIVDALANRLPLRAVCLQRGLALQWMLRRRGVDAALHYGIRLPGDEDAIAAHVWISVEGEVILGAPQHQHYTEVARYPEPAVR